MPEWPEMEIYRRLLSERLCGHAITSAEVNRAKTINEPVETFRQALIGKRVLFVERKGKQIVFHLDDGNRLLLHLMLGGWLYYGTEGPKHDEAFQVILGFDDGNRLYFGGLRLGYLHRLSAKSVLEQLKAIGPDPFDPRLTPDAFHSRLKAKRGKLKSALTDQKWLSGIGNCYADEIAFHARLHPEVDVKSIDREQSDRLYASMHNVLEEATAQGGYMDRPFASDDMLLGGFNEHCRVYDREGQPCVACGTPIEKDELGGRKVFYCPSCQQKA